MLRKILIFALPFLFLSCASQVAKTELDLLFERNFEGLTVPEATKIKTEGGHKSFPHTTFDQVWDSAIIVLMQGGIITRSLKDSGLIVTIATPPSTILIEEDEEVNVYLYWMQDLYRQSDKPEKILLEFTPVDIMKASEAFFDKLATQVYSGQKWKYLQGTN